MSPTPTPCEQSFSCWEWGLAREGVTCPQGLPVGPVSDFLTFFPWSTFLYAPTSARAVVCLFSQRPVDSGILASLGFFFTILWSKTEQNTGVYAVCPEFWSGPRVMVRVPNAVVLHGVDCGGIARVPRPLQQQPALCQAGDNRGWVSADAGASELRRWLSFHSEPPDTVREI